MILPAFGIVSAVVPAFARKPLFGYVSMVYATASIAILSFLQCAGFAGRARVRPDAGVFFICVVIPWLRRKGIAAAQRLWDCATPPLLNESANRLIA